MFNVNEVAENICAKNPSIVEWINSNAENYKPVRQQINALARTIADKYNDGKFINSNDLHRLTWKIIDCAKGNSSPFTITEV